jgi:hypothetical protein
MIEPIYSYERGKGWFVQCAPLQVVFKLEDGRTVTVIDRIPLKGEWAWDILGDDGWYPTDAEWAVIRAKLWKPNADLLLKCRYNLDHDGRNNYGWRNDYEDLVNNGTDYYVTLITSDRD